MGFFIAWYVIFVHSWISNSKREWTKKPEVWLLFCDYSKIIWMIKDCFFLLLELYTKENNNYVSDMIEIKIEEKKAIYKNIYIYY